jgi:hypothetical protein
VFALVTVGRNFPFVYCQSFWMPDPPYYYRPMYYSIIIVMLLFLTCSCSYYLWWNIWRDSRVIQWRGPSSHIGLHYCRWLSIHVHEPIVGLRWYDTCHLWGWRNACSLLEILYWWSHMSSHGWGLKRVG